MQLYTGPQVLYAGAGHKLDWLPPEEGRCRVCGGQLLAPVQKMKNLGLWTDEKLIADPASPHVCAACDWVIKNRTYVSKAKVLWSNLNQNLKYDNFEEILSVWSTDFACPSVFMLWDSGASAHQKHTMLRTVQAVTYSPENTHVLLYGLGQLGNIKPLTPPFSTIGWNHTVAIVSFSAPKMVQNVERLLPKASKRLENILVQVSKQKRKKPFELHKANRYSVVGTLMRDLSQLCAPFALDPLTHLTLRLAAERSATLSGVPLRIREVKK